VNASQVTVEDRLRLRMHPDSCRQWNAGIDHHALGATGSKRVFHLRRTEEGGQRYMHRAHAAQGQVQRQPFRSVVQAACNTGHPVPGKCFHDTFNARMQGVIAEHAIARDDARRGTAQSVDQSFEITHVATAMRNPNAGTAASSATLAAAMRAR
jgi:hypothetical protein